MKNWYKNMPKGQKMFVWLVSVALICAWLVGLVPVAILAYLELGERGRLSE